MPTADTPLYFAATGLMQSSNFSLGIGTTTPFQFVGAPDFDGDKLTELLNNYNLPGIVFLQKYYMAMTYEKRETKDRTTVLCNGTFMVIKDRETFRPVETQFYIMESLCKLFPDKINLELTPDSRSRMCTDEICDAIKTKSSLLPINEKWKLGAKEFEKQRKAYLLY